MRVALVGLVEEENLALGYLHAALVEAGHQVELFGFPAPDRFEEAADAVVRARPDLVGLSMVFTVRAIEFVRFAQRLRGLGYRGHVTAGGQFATLHAEPLLQDAPALDSVLHGEGEEALVDLVEHLGALDRVAGLTWRPGRGRVATNPLRAPVEDLDQRRWPTRPVELDRYLGLPLAGMLGSRGCFAACRFCSISAWHRHLGGPAFRMRSENDVAAEMAQLYHHRGVRIFNFHDDNFFLRKRADSVARIRALRRGLDARGVGRVAVQVKSRPDTIDPETVAAMKDLGVFRVFLGVESNSVKGLKALGRGIRHEQNDVALRLLLDAGFHVSFNLLAFEPDATVSDLRDNIAFIRRYPEVPLNVCRTEVYAGTPLERDLLAEGRLLGSYFGYDYRLRDAAAQRVFEVFRVVFTERNFQGDGMNLRAMALDYQLELLRHFWPERVTPGLVRRTRALIRAVNDSNADYLERTCDFAETGPSDEATAVFATRLNAERTALDRDLLERGNAILREIEALSGAPLGDPETPGLSRGVLRAPAPPPAARATAGAVALKVGIGVALTLATATAFVSYFGDNIRALFGASTELAGEISRDVPRPEGGETRHWGDED